MQNADLNENGHLEVSGSSLADRHFQLLVLTSGCLKSWSECVQVGHDGRLDGGQRRLQLRHQVSNPGLVASSRFVAGLRPLRLLGRGEDEASDAGGRQVAEAAIRGQARTC